MSAAIRKKLQQLGNSTALVLDQPLLDVLGARNGSVVSVSVTPTGTVVLSHAGGLPAHSRTERLAALERSVKRYFDRDPVRAVSRKRVG